MLFVQRQCQSSTRAVSGYLTNKAKSYAGMDLHAPLLSGSGHLTALQLQWRPQTRRTYCTLDASCKPWSSRQVFCSHHVRGYGYPVLVLTDGMLCCAANSRQATARTLTSFNELPSSQWPPDDLTVGLKRVAMQFSHGNVQLFCVLAGQ